jgi:predicted nucleotidyltransferase
MELLKEVYERRRKYFEKLEAGEAIEAEIYLYGSVVEGKS